MCGIFGIMSSTTTVSPLIVDALSCLQHRGQDAVGIATCDGSELYSKRSKGMVRDVFTSINQFNTLKGNYGIGHVRYPTAGGNTTREHQPFYVNSPYGILIAHNGNLTNAESLKQELFQTNKRHINSSSDSEVLLNVFAHGLRLTDDIFQAASYVCEKCQGAYSAVFLVVGVGLVAIRDRNGIRPLVIGERTNLDGSIDYAIASESVALSILGFSIKQDVTKGSCVFINTDGELVEKAIDSFGDFTPCAFEYVYLARPDSILDGVSVYRTRLRMGQNLAKEVIENLSCGDVDVVIPIPDTSAPTALSLANALNLKYREGLVKNRYIGRTFIMEDQVTRQESIRRKLNVLDIEFVNKNVLLVDDSIVRGNTSKQIVQMVRKAGANKVYFASAAPEIRYQNIYGIDMPTKDQLACNIADKHNISLEQMLNADRVIFQKIEGLEAAIMDGNQKITQLEESIFTGLYPTSVSAEYLTYIQQTRGQDDC